MPTDETGLQSLTEDQQNRILAEHEENGLEDAFHEALLYQPSDADKTDWLTSVFRGLDIIDSNEEIVKKGSMNTLWAREIAQPADCPKCGEQADHAVSNVERLSTPTQIDHSWEICTVDGTLYIHNTHGGDYIGRRSRR